MYPVVLQRHATYSSSQSNDNTADREPEEDDWDRLPSGEPEGHDCRDSAGQGRSKHVGAPISPVVKWAPNSKLDGDRIQVWQLTKLEIDSPTKGYANEEGGCAHPCWTILESSHRFQP
jgi:hypothetical protein